MDDAHHVANLIVVDANDQRRETSMSDRGVSLDLCRRHAAIGQLRQQGIGIRGLNDRQDEPQRALTD
jgi:hypothetical protein